jgi:hypothetical protein
MNDETLIMLVAISNLMNLGHSAKHVEHVYEQATREVQQYRQSENQSGSERR